ncbi:hypothetical protein O3P69_013372 [Scylla paramamosain]|uniref:Uncharacterized protein n=1 Tax=Scylla paramamosain TaxID=85552 RepID=A0AAW0U0K3_SCYPA
MFPITLTRYKCCPAAWCPGAGGWGRPCQYPWNILLPQPSISGCSRSFSERAAGQFAGESSGRCSRRPPFITMCGSYALSRNKSSTKGVGSDGGHGAAGWQRDSQGFTPLSAAVQAPVGNARRGKSQGSRPESVPL